MTSLILAFESSCDDTAIALVDEKGRVVAQSVLSQVDVHNRFGGVVPELASRLHESALDSLVRELLEKNLDSQSKISKVAATCGPGLIGPLLVGKCYAQGLALGWGLPFVGVHHLRGHVASVLLDLPSDAPICDKAKKVFPAIVLLVSGGHTQVLRVDEKLQGEVLLSSHDDAAGECFDKAAKLMGLSYPGGPAIEKMAHQLNSDKLPQARHLSSALPRPQSEAGFSFAGLKTAIRIKLEKEPLLAQQEAFAWAVQDSVGEALLAGLSRIEKNLVDAPCKSFVFCGGVSANLSIREKVQVWARKSDLNLYIPEIKYCTDNAAMIGAAAWIQDESLNLQDVAARISL